jgi:ABC-type antimicrobial peptide transport system permease subunit
MIVITGILAAIYPSIKTIKLRPADAIRTYG